MVSTPEFLPSAALRPFVQRFAYREFRTLEMELCRPLPAMPEFLITFNLNGHPVVFHSPEMNKGQSHIPHAINAGTVVNGINDHFIGIIRFKGYYHLFSIQFTPTGFYRIFGVPAPTSPIRSKKGFVY